jgi:hypothetical protein
VVVVNRAAARIRMHSNGERKHRGNVWHMGTPFIVPQIISPAPSTSLLVGSRTGAIAP